MRTILMILGIALLLAGLFTVMRRGGWPGFCAEKDKDLKSY